MFNTRSVPGSLSPDNTGQAKRRASRLYRQACEQTWLVRLWSILKGRRPRLLDLAEIKRTGAIINYHYIGKQFVRLSQIQGSGSQGRCYDFDADFRPLKAHSQSRWLSVAMAWQLGKKLPPVDLVQVGEIYFVEDGHHRISVAKAMGYEEIEAVVTLWELNRYFFKQL